MADHKRYDPSELAPRQVKEYMDQAPAAMLPTGGGEEHGGGVRAAQGRSRQC